MLLISTSSVSLPTCGVQFSWDLELVSSAEGSEREGFASGCSRRLDP